jgi:hypothetical protein
MKSLVDIICQENINLQHTSVHHHRYHTRNTRKAIVMDFPSPYHSKYHSKHKHKQQKNNNMDDDTNKSDDNIAEMSFNLCPFAPRLDPSVAPQIVMDAMQRISLYSIE